jgi:Flp pilus assembly protein TadG
MMKSPLDRRRSLSPPTRADERGVTIILVALSMVGILAMAALSIDVVTLYLARLEAQRAADAGALAGARVLSLSGVTGDPNNKSGAWVTYCPLAIQVAKAVASQGNVGATAPSAPTVTFLYKGSIVACTTPSGGFAVNPQVQVQVQRASLPTFFARMWNQPSSVITATATAEAFNSSGSAGLGSGITPVQPRCVKPWIVPNQDPRNPGTTCTGPGGCSTLTSPADGSITNPGISLGGVGTSGVIGETFSLVPDCVATGADCSPPDNPPVANTGRSGTPATNLDYLPGQVLNTSIAAPTTGGDACADSTSLFAKAITGCDETTVYRCGVQNGNTIDLGENPRSSGDTANAGRCLIHQATAAFPSGQDTLDTSTFPFIIKAGSDYPVTAVRGDTITSSSSIVSLPIYDVSVTYVPGKPVGTVNASGTTNVTIVGFLQVFINQVDGNGVVHVTVLNVAGCSNGNGTSSVGTAVAGSSPVPVRLITPP